MEAFEFQHDNDFQKFLESVKADFHEKQDISTTDRLHPDHSIKLNMKKLCYKMPELLKESIEISLKLKDCRPD